MNRIAVAAMLVGLAAPWMSAVTAQEDPEDYVSLELPVTELQELDERCPIRVEMPLAGLKVGKRTKTFGIRARYLQCRDVRISHVRVRARKLRAIWLELHASAYVIAPKGRDSDARLEYDFVSGDGEVFSARQYLELDEGEKNWGDGISVEVPRSTDLESLRLRIQMTTPADW